MLGSPIASAQQGYAAEQFACATFSEAVESELHVEMGGRTRVSRAGREGLLVVRGTRDSAGIRIEAWYDSLRVWRRTPEGELAPDPDGIVGGRFTGRLGPRGQYRATARPFLPPEIGEVVRLDRVLDDFFPRLPPVPLDPAQSWRDSAGSEIRRLADSVAGTTGLGRFAYARAATLVQDDPAATDTLTPGLEEEGREEGRFVWHPQEGLLRTEREITVTSEVPVSRFVRAPVRSRLTQRIRVERKPATGSACAAEAP
jgi:hypothetical protein